MSKEAELQEPLAPATKEPAPEMAVMPRALLVRSKTNPRTNFDPTYIQELSESIADLGVVQALLVRPLPGHRVQETAEDRAPGAPLPTHEIVCGECRDRACELAGVDQVPVLIRHLTDEQAAQIQLVENLKRRDLHPLEEAEGFDRLIRDHKMTVEAIAIKVKKSESYVYKTLKLLELTPECRQEMLAGKLDRSVALLVARAPDYLQAKITKDLMTPDWQGETMSYRKAVKHIENTYMLRLAEAVFDIKDAGLLKKAGSCQECPKRTGANKALFEDIDAADTCTDPNCFNDKKEAHYAAIAAKAKENGQTVIMGKEAKELIRDEYSGPKGYTLLDERDYVDGRSTTIRSLIGKENLPKPVLILNPHTKQLQEALPVDVAEKLITKAKRQRTAAKKDAEASREPTKQDLEDRYERDWQGRFLRRVHETLQGDGIHQVGNHARSELIRALAVRFLMTSDIMENRDICCELLGVGKVASDSGLEDYVKTCTPEQLAPALVVLVLADELDAFNGKTFPMQELFAGELAIDVKALQAEVKKAMKAEAAERQAAKSGATAEPAKPAKGKKAKKTSKEDAQAGIAQALQQQEPPAAGQVDVNTVETPNWPFPVAYASLQPGTAIRVKEGLRGPSNHFRKICGKEGTLDKLVNGTWRAKINGSKDTHALKAGEFEILPVAATVAPTIDPVKAWPFPKAK